MENFDNARPATNTQLDCLGASASQGDTNYGAMQKCYADVANLRNTAPSGFDANDMGVNAVRDGVLHNLQQGNIGAVEKFLKDPTTQNIPAGGEALPQIGFNSTTESEKPMNIGGMPVNPDIAGPLEHMGNALHDFGNRLKGYDPSTEHKDALVRQTTDLLKSPAGHDLVIQYDHENGPN